jgi:hypothetical protein
MPFASGRTQRGQALPATSPVGRALYDGSETGGRPVAACDIPCDHLSASLQGDSERLEFPAASSACCQRDCGYRQGEIALYKPCPVRGESSFRCTAEMASAERFQVETPGTAESAESAEAARKEMI